MQQPALRTSSIDDDMPAEAMPRAEIVDSIRSVGREAWNACFPGEVEAYDYLLAVEQAGIGGFAWCYVIVRDHDEIFAAMPAFLCSYLLETTLEAGRTRRAINAVRRVFSGFLTLRLACLGSPCTETGVVGFHPGISEHRRGELFACLLEAFESHAKAKGCSLMAVKDLALPPQPQIDRILSSSGYAEIGGMPTAWLDIDFDTMEAYFTRLSAGTRKDMRRKLRARETVRIEHRSEFGDLLPRVMQLYQETRERSEWQFEELTPAYFNGILAGMPGKSFCTMYFVGDELLAANLLVHDGERLIDKFFCMDAERGRPYNLYYLSWFDNLDYCLHHGIVRYQSGQAYYRNKVRLGSQLTANAMFFRHRNRLIQFILEKISPLLAADEGAGTVS